jgi:tetratricopeptide (TPR) repeat protein/tRNA A-37 threonylcarbamoyl transferase component Bud32
MADPYRCPVCGAERSASAVAGLCPRCLVLRALGEETAVPADSTSVAEPGSTGARASLERTEPDPETTRAPGDVAGPTTVQGPGRAASDLPTTASDLTQTADGNEPTRDLARAALVRYFGDYEINRELGRGGMGVVYHARQVSLNRPVALKMIRAGILADDADLRRFQNEAEAVALLDHEGIVPVYEVGEHEGQKYFSMKLVEGGNLAEQLTRFIDNPRAAATLLAEAALAVHHAHIRGILHRDLKPANVLIDTEGHPHVTDFGLAKRVEADPELTASGVILGTPAYMSPEQAAGHRGTITTATDVYGLGAIFYALLAGKAPFGRESLIDTLEAVRSRPPEPPSTINAKVPRDLETICLKCLKKDPRRRYAGAQALAEDLKAWLNSRPISARRVGKAERAWLWCKRRPAVAALTAAVLLASLGGIAAVITVQASANAGLRAANEREKQRFRLAMDAIKLFHGEVSEDVLMKEKQFEGLRTKLLKGAADFYGRLEDLLSNQTDRESRAALAKAYVELAALTGQIGDQTRALAVHRKALAVQRALASEPGADSTIKLDVARSLTASGWLERSTGNVAGALQSFEQARKLAEDVGTDASAAEQARGVLGTAYSLTGNVLAETGDPAGARAAYSEALKIRQALADGNPNDRDVQRNLAAAHNSLGLLEEKSGDPTRALPAYRRALAIQQKLAGAHPGVSEFQQDLAWSQMSIGIALSETGDPTGARTAYEKALAIRQKLADDAPTVTVFQDDLANGYMNLGALMATTGDANGARAAYGEAITIRQKLADSNPGVVQFRQELAKSLKYLGILLAATGDLSGARAFYDQALAIEQKQADSNPDVIDFQRDVANSFNNIGALIGQTGDPVGARRFFAKALQIRQKLADSNPGIAGYQLDVAMCHSNIGAMLERTGDLAEAQAACGKALAIQQKLADTDPSVTGFQLDLARSHFNIGTLLSQAGHAAEARAAHGRALDIQQKLADSNPSVTAFQQDLARIHENIGILLSAMGDRSGAGEAHVKALAIRQKLAEANSSIPEFQADVARSFTDLGSLRQKSGQPGEAVDYFSREEAIWKKLADANPSVPDYKASLANCQVNGATVLLRLERVAEARVRCEQSVALREALAAAAPNVPQYRKNLGESLLRFGQVRRAEGDLIGASADWKRAGGLFKTVSPLDGEYTFFYACCQASLSNVAGNQGTGIAALEREALSNQAMALLHQAASLGYRNLGAYRSETALDALRTRDDFRLLLLDLSFPLDPIAR